MTFWGIIMRIGEIIETGTTGFVAESLELNRPPDLGSLVKVEVGEGACVYGLAAARYDAAPLRSTTGPSMTSTRS
jgi:hypothetical protein